MKPENTFRVWFIDKARGYLAQHYPGVRVRFQKHADHITSGVPDMDVAIHGVTLWFEFKHYPTLKTERKLDVTPLQHNYLRELAEARVGRGVLVGLALGPRKGYDVALYNKAIPTVSARNDFRPWTVAVDEMVAMAAEGAFTSHEALSSISCHRPVLVGHLPLLSCRVPHGLDDAHEDGG